MRKCITILLTLFSTLWLLGSFIYRGDNSNILFIPEINARGGFHIPIPSNPPPVVQFIINHSPPPPPPLPPPPPPPPPPAPPPPPPTVFQAVFQTIVQAVQVAVPAWSPPAPSAPPPPPSQIRQQAEERRAEQEQRRDEQQRQIHTQIQNIQEQVNNAIATLRAQSADGGRQNIQNVVSNLREQINSLERQGEANQSQNRLRELREQLQTIEQENRRNIITNAVTNIKDRIKNFLANRPRLQIKTERVIAPSQISWSSNAEKCVEAHIPTDFPSGKISVRPFQKTVYNIVCFDKAGGASNITIPIEPRIRTIKTMVPVGNRR